ncbi:MAG: hypothetical protein NT096_00110 [Proteobacteria bacterium]|nr:hypothetical protein [Pseudomonadota bacterium]
MKTYLIPKYGITIKVENGSGIIKSKLKEHLIEEVIGTEDPVIHGCVSGAVDALESLIMAHAVAGIDVASPAYIEGLDTCMEALGNHL